MTVSSMMSVWAEMARTRPDAAALTVGDAPPVTWGTLHRRSNQMARLLAMNGVVPGDLVTLVLPTGVDVVVAMLATLKVGATPNPISDRLPATEQQQLLALAGPRVVVTDSDAIETDRPKLSGSPNPSGIDDSDLPDVIAKSFKAPTSGGSTGLPKIILSGAPAMIDDDPAGGLRALGFPADGCCLFASPIHHNAALLGTLIGLSLRNHVVLEDHFDAELTLRLIERHRVTFTILVPTMMNRIWRLPEAVRTSYDVSSLQTVMHTAAPIAPDLKRGWLEWLGPERVLETYTATEQSAMTICGGRDWLERPGTVGRVVVGEMEVRSVEGHPCPPGEIGVIYMRRPAGTPRTFTYIGEETVEDADRWETVGDLGYFDTDGYLFLSDRRTDLIVRGGANIYPAEVENALAAHPEVIEAVVIGLPDDDMGQRVHAVVQVADGSVVTETDLNSHLDDRIARYKRPRTYEFTFAALRDDAGKVRRGAMRDARASGDHLTA